MTEDSVPDFIGDVIIKFKDGSVISLAKLIRENFKQSIIWERFAEDLAILVPTELIMKLKNTQLKEKKALREGLSRRFLNLIGKTFAFYLDWDNVDMVIVVKRPLGSQKEK